jgi:hypothetical protein
MKNLVAMRKLRDVHAAQQAEIQQLNEELVTLQRRNYPSFDHLDQPPRMADARLNF